MIICRYGLSEATNGFVKIGLFQRRNCILSFFIYFKQKTVNQSLNKKNFMAPIYG